VWGNHCSLRHIALWITIGIHSVLLFLFLFEFLLWFFLNFFYWFYLLIFGWLRIWLHNLFPFILPFYKVSMIYGFARIIEVALVYEFGGVFFFNWSWLFYHLFFFHMVKKIIKKTYIIKLYKVYEPIHKFGCLTWLAGSDKFNFLN
jgi:hypothetical protein